MKMIQLSEASKLTGISRQTLTNWISKGILPHNKISGTYYVDEDTIKQLFEPMLDAEMARKAFEAEKEQYNSLREECRAWMNAERDEFNKDRILSICVNSGVRTGFFDAIIKMLNEIGELSDNEAFVLSRVLFGDDMAFIAKENNTTRERIRQIAEKAIRKSEVLKKFREKVNTIKDYESQIELLKSDIETIKRVFGKNADTSLSDVEKSISKMNREMLIKLLEKSVKECGFTTRTQNILRAPSGIQKEIKTVGELCGLSRVEFLSYRGAGQKSADEVEDYLHSIGLDWGIDTEKVLNITY